MFDKKDLDVSHAWLEKKDRQFNNQPIVRDVTSSNSMSFGGSRGLSVVPAVPLIMKERNVKLKLLITTLVEVST